MPYTLTLATPDTRDLVVTALRTAADQRTRVARGAARKVAEAKAARRDVRSQAVKVTDLLAEADVLAELAADLEQQPALPLVVADTTASGEDPAPASAEDPAGDGLSAAAHRAAALAGLEDALPDPDDPTLDTGATAEDEPDDAEEVTL